MTSSSNNTNIKSTPPALTNRVNLIKKRWVYLPLLLCSSVVIAAGQTVSSPRFEDDFREVNNANFDYVGGRTRIGVGIDTEFDGTADISHIFSETDDTATSGDAWVGFDFSGADKGVNAGGVKLNHHWVSRDEQGRPLRVNKIFGAYDQNTHGDDRATIGYGQEIDKGFWEGYVGKGLSGKRAVRELVNGQTVSEKGYRYNVGGQVGTFLPGSNIRVRGGLDYAWDNERGFGEDKPEQLTISGGVEKFYQGTPHSVSLDVAASRNDGGFGKSDTDTRANLSYHYDFSGADIYQSDKKIRRVRVEMPGHGHSARTVKKAIKTPYRQAYKKAVRVKTCQLVKSTVELGSDTFFKANSSVLLPSAKKRLSKVLSQIRHTGYQGNIRITGNTCDIGTAQHNQVLSERRAGVVKRYFAAHGFDRSELIARGLGETKPKYANTAGNRHRNRRVDIEYVTQDKSCQESYKTVYKTAYKAAYRTAYKNVVIQQAGVSKPSVTWKTEVVQGEPTWVKRGLRNSIRHNRYINVYQTTAGGGRGSSNGTVPTLINDSVSTSLNTPVTINALINDAGNGLTISSVAQPVHGTATILNGAIVYTPDQGFTGTDTFTYNAVDVNGVQAQATVTVNVAGPQIPTQPTNPTGANVPPVPQNDTATTTTGHIVTIDVLNNDTDADDDIITIVGITQPASGTVIIDHGLITYQPVAGFVGTETFTYTVSDAHGHVSTATVTVNVTDPGPGTGAPNVAPIAQNDVINSNGNTVIFDVLNNDTDADNDVLTITSVTQPQNNFVLIDSNEIVFLPSEGFTGSDLFTYTISDGNGHVSTAVVNVVVTGNSNVTVNAGSGGSNSNTNTAPVAQDDRINSTGQPVTINVLSNDSDVDRDTLVIVGVTQPQNGSVRVNNNQLVFTPNQQFIGADSFTYTVSDGNGNQTIASVNVLVSALSNAAPDINDDFVDVNGTSIGINVLGNDNDADNDRLTIINFTQPKNGFVTRDHDRILFIPNQGFTGTDSFSYTVSDGQGNRGSAIVTLRAVNA